MAAVVAAEAAPATMDAVAEKAAPQADAVASKPPSAAPLKTPLAAPGPDSTPPPRPELTPEQQTKYEWLLGQAQGWTAVPKTVRTAHLHGTKNYPASADEDEMAPLATAERMWLTRECLLRYLRATKWHEPDAEKRLLATLAWRREFGVDALTPDHISPEQETGKQLIMGYDRDGRVCHYLMPGRQNTAHSPRQMQHLVFMLERVLDLMVPGQESLALLVDHSPSKTRSNTSPPISQARETLNIVQTHYPERLGRAISVHLPWVVYGFYKLVNPFIDPRTREKLKLNEDVTKYVPRDTLLATFGGDLDFEYDHDTYWPALNALCEERRDARRRRWEAGGSLIGELEDYLMGGVDVGITGSAKADAAAEDLAKSTEAMKLADPAAGEAKADAQGPKDDAAPEEHAVAVAL